jgi:hypothetical protein
LVVHCFDRDHPPPPSLAKHVSTLDTVYPRIQSSLLCVQAPFTPVTIEWLSRELFIPKVHRKSNTHFTTQCHAVEGVMRRVDGWLCFFVVWWCRI